MAELDKNLIRGSLILLITFNLYNLLNFVFHFSMARLLSIVDYGIMATLFSIIYVLGIFSESIQTVIAKYSSTENDKGKLKNLFKRSFKKSTKISLILFTIYILIAIPLTFVLKIQYPLLLITGLLIFSSFLVPLTRGIMQGRKMFKALGLNLVIEAVLKVILAVGLVFIGWKVFGAIIATIIGTAAALFISAIIIKRDLKGEEKTANTINIYKYTTPVILSTFVILIFFSIDVIIAKIVFPAQIAGYYAISSILAKTIFLGTQPISKAMFPLSAESKTGGSKNIYTNALIILILCIVVALVVFYFFPEFIVNIFTGKIIPESAAILFYVGIAMSLLSLANLNILHKLSLGGIKHAPYLLIFVVIEVVMLFFFSKTLTQFSIAFIISSGIFLIGSLFFPHDESVNNNTSI